MRLPPNLLRRDWRVLLAVGSISTIGLFADRVRLALQQEATSLIGMSPAPILENLLLEDLQWMQLLVGDRLVS
jgi:hypothetical protein